MSEQSEASARLIADLLEALELAETWMGEWNRRPYVMETIRAAIAKAKGES